MTYEIWYIPRIQDELVVAKFETEHEAQVAMTELKDKFLLICISVLSFIPKPEN